MEDYRELGSKYLKTNKKRSLITLIGCFIVAAGLFMFLNSMVCWVENCREEAREKDDWEILILTDDKDTIEKIVNEDFVQSAFIGKAYGAYQYLTEDLIQENPIYANALHINVKQKLRINHYSKYIENTYGDKIEGVELNDLLAWTYCQDNDGIGYLMLLGGLLIAFILAIIGVGVLRNNISISAIERVKDYGNLRCIGATKKQIKAIVYRESVFLETVGIAAGVLAGFLLSIPVCLQEKRQYPIGFHIIPLIMLLIAFYGDMYFAVDDGLKKVLAVSPSEAVRGNYRIKLRGLKRRNSGIWGCIFGVEGDYAYKNIKRNNGRFLKTVAAMSFGMIIVVVAGGELETLFKFYDKVDSQYGYFQHYIMCNTNGIYSYEEQRMDLYSPEALKKITAAKGIEAPKFMYSDTLYTVEDRWVTSNMNEDYKYNTYAGTIYTHVDMTWTEEDKRYWTEEVKPETGKTALEEWREDHPEFADETPWSVDEKERSEAKAERKAYRDTGKGLVDYDSRDALDLELNNPNNLANSQEYTDLWGTQIDIVGYDSEDYARYEDVLVEGTTELSENGILLVNQGDLEAKESSNDNALLLATEEFTFLNVKVGDEIKVVDPAELNKLVQAEREIAEEHDKMMHEKAAEWDQEHGDETDENGNPVKNPYADYGNITELGRKKGWIINSAREKLIDEGKYKTYVIEGIVKNDPNFQTMAPTIIVPLDKFYDITGRTEKDYNGMMFHVSNIFSSDLQKNDFINAINERQGNYIYGVLDEGSPDYNSITSVYFEGVDLIVSGVKTALAIVAVFIVLISISLLNTLNVNISSLQTRRNEFAQLRSLGMTKRSLLKAVLLEGGIVWIISTVLGIIFGLIIEYVLYVSLFQYVTNLGMLIFWPGIIIATILSLIVLCGSNYIFFNQMKLNVAEQLTRSGE